MQELKLGLRTQVLVTPDVLAKTLIVAHADFTKGELKRVSIRERRTHDETTML